VGGKLPVVFFATIDALQGSSQSGVHLLPGTRRYVTPGKSSSNPPFSLFQGYLRLIK